MDVMRAVSGRALQPIRIGVRRVDPARLVVLQPDGTEQPLRAKSMAVLLRLAQGSPLALARFGLGSPVIGKLHHHEWHRRVPPGRAPAGNKST